MLLDIHETARELGCSPVSLYQKPFRLRLGLVATRIGNRLRFHPDDIQKVIASGRERLHQMPKEAKDAAD